MKSLIFFMMFLMSLSAISQEQKVELIGICTLTQAGSCRMDSSPFEVKIMLTIDQNTGKITGQEFRKDKTNKYIKEEIIQWSGEVLNAKAMRLQQNKELTCGTVKRTEILHFIAVAGENYNIKISDRFAMCPSSNCIFDIDYDLQVQ